MCKKFIYTTLLLLFALIPAITFGTQKFAAFDLGSGKFKVLIAEVDGPEVIISFARTIDVPLGHDLAQSADHKLSLRVQEVAINALKELQREARDRGAERFSGVATAAFRNALNGEAFLNELMQKTGIQLKMISQDQEGILAFNSASICQPALDPEHLIVFDTGGASFQMTAKQGDDYFVYNGPFGSSTVAKALSEEIRKVPYKQEGPEELANIAEIQELIDNLKSKLNPCPWIEKKLHGQKSATMLYLASESSILRTLPEFTGQITKDELWSILENLSGASTSYPCIANLDLEKKRANINIYSLLYSAMSKFEFDVIELGKAGGGGNALGLIKDQKFWN